MPTVLHDIAWRRCRCMARSAVSNEMPFAGLVLARRHWPGRRPTEVHKVTVARQLLREYKATDDLWPTDTPKRLEAAKAKYAEYLEHEVATCDRFRRLGMDGRPGFDGKVSRSSNASSPAARRTRSTNCAVETSTA